MKKSLLILLFLFCGCTARRMGPVREVSGTVTVYRDTTIYVSIRGDTVYLASGGGSDSISRLSTGLAVSEAWVEQGILKHRLLQKDTLIGSTIRNAIRTTTTSRLKEQTVEVKPPKSEKLSFWNRRLKGVVVIGAVIILIGLLLKWRR